VIAGLSNLMMQGLLRLKYLRMLVTDQNYINEYINNRLDSGNDWSPSIHYVLPFYFPPRNLNIKIKRL
jgi:hypothetical protein